MTKVWLFVGCILAFCVMLTTPATAEIIVDGDFSASDSLLEPAYDNVWTKNVDSYGQWYHQNSWRLETETLQDGTTRNYALQPRTSGDSYRLLQILDNGKSAKGEHRLTVQMGGLWNGHLMVAGYQADAWNALEGVSVLDSRLPNGYTGLFDGGGYARSVSGDQSPLPPREHTLDLGEGYDYILVILTTKASGYDNYPTVYNVSLSPEPATLSLLGLGGLLVLRRRRR